MNIPTTPDLESLRKAVLAFQPNPRRVPFNNLKPHHDAIATLRAKQVSYSLIAELLEQHGVKTSRARVAEYGRIMLEGGKRRKRRKSRNYSPSPATAVKFEVIEPRRQPSNDANALAPRTRGPRIARIRMADGSILGENNAGAVTH